MFNSNNYYIKMYTNCNLNYDTIIMHQIRIFTHLSLQFASEARCNVILWRDIEAKSRGVDGGCLGRVLHQQERLDRLHLRLVRAVGQRATLGRQTARCHPLSVLLLL